MYELPRKVYQEYSLCLRTELITPSCHYYSLNNMYKFLYILQHLGLLSLTARMFKGESYFVFVLDSVD